MEAVRTILTGDCAMPWVHCDKTGVLKGFVVCGGFGLLMRTNLWMGQVFLGSICGLSSPQSTPDVTRTSGKLSEEPGGFVC